MYQNDYRVKVYCKTDVNLWNDFVTQAKNATFLFCRGFMEYHSDRFEDFSLLIFKKNELIALLPANKKGNIVYSHQGLTYGGFITKAQITITDTQAILNEVFRFLINSNFKTLFIKQLPSIYRTIPSYEFDYSIRQQTFKMNKTHLILAVDLKRPLHIHKSKLKNYRRAEKNNVYVEESNDLEAFWTLILEPKLKHKYNAKPVHALHEIKALKAKFPMQIRQFNAYLEGVIVAGITLFESQGVVKSQYGASNSLGEHNKALDYLFLKLITKFKNEGKSFFSMGTVSNDSALGFNAGMLKQKQELGCEVFLQDFYTITL